MKLCNYNQLASAKHKHTHTLPSDSVTVNSNLFEKRIPIIKDSKHNYKT